MSNNANQESPNSKLGSLGLDLSGDRKLNGMDRKSYMMMRIMLETGINKDAIAALLEVAGFSAAHVRYFAGPVVMCSAAWMSTIPEWVLNACYLDRLELIVEEANAGKPGEIATATEVMAYLYPATLEAPMHHDWAQVYFWAGNEAMVRHQRLPKGVQTLWELLEMRHPVEFEDICRDYTQLAGDIRRKVVEVAKQRGWGYKRKAQVQQPVKAEAPNIASDVVQLKLF